MKATCHPSAEFFFVLETKSSPLKNVLKAILTKIFGIENLKNLKLKGIIESNVWMKSPSPF